MMTLTAPADGPLARRTSWLVIPAALLGGLVAYMVIGSVASLVWMLLNGGSLSDLLDLPGGSIGLQALLGGNAVGLVLGLGLVGFLLARLDSSRPAVVLRLAKPRLGALALSVVGLVALQPVVLWLGHLNSTLPMPEFIRSMEQQQLELIKWIVQGDGLLMVNLVLVAVVPGICEEVFFRGYIQRRAERSWGVAWGIAFSGIIFGVFHLRLTEALPLCALGLYMAYLVWCTGSIWVPITVHFINNAAALVQGRISGEDMLEPTAIPWPWVLLGLVVFAGTIGLLHFKRHAVHGSDGLD